jgi:hypothetical protein
LGKHFLYSGKHHHQMRNQDKEVQKCRCGVYSVTKEPALKEEDTAKKIKAFLAFFKLFKSNYSHSIVAGGLLLMSYTTRLIPLTLLIISLEMWAKNSYGKCAQSAVMPSTLVTALSATVNS